MAVSSQSSAAKFWIASPEAPSSTAPQQVGDLASPARSIADVTKLLALACQAPAALFAVRQETGSWNPIGFGFDSQAGLNDRRLFEVLAVSDEPVEIANTLNSNGKLVGSSLVRPPHLMRWIYGRSMRDSPGCINAVVAVLDRQPRIATRREHQAMAAAARRLVDTLDRLPLPAQPPTRSMDTTLARRPSDDPAEQRPRPLMISKEVAYLFDVTERTVINWAASGKLPCIRTVGGHLRFHREEILKLLG